MSIEQNVELFNGWVEREKNSLQSELNATNDVNMINYINGKLYELTLIAELMPRVKREK